MNSELRLLRQWLSRGAQAGLAAKLFLSMVLAAGTSLGQSNAATAAGADTGGVTLEQFRSQVESRLAAARGTGKSREKTPLPDLRPAEELFLQLLLAQARDAAAHQSVDRMEGWRKSIESRFQTQNAPELDVDTIRFAVAKMTAESARIESELKQLIARANAMLGRPPDSPLTALLPATAEDPPEDSQKKQKEVLAQGEELVSKLYKSYQFGGIPLSALLWNEQELYQTEVRYRSNVARDAVRSADGAGSH